MADQMKPRAFHEWHEDHGNVLWWRWPIEEPPYCGTPLDIGFAVGAQLFNQFGDVIGTVQADVGGWPYGTDEEAMSDLWWTPLPDANALDVAIRDEIRGGPDNG